ncbi:MAG: 3-deoxy-D-manno-octulosonic acid transferase [Paracoccaceae bacterium]
MLLYRLLASLALPLLVLRLALRCLIGAERFSDLAERLGRSGRTGPLPGPLPGPGPVLWLHAASNGEYASARRLAHELLARVADLRLLVTVNTLSARELVREEDHPRIFPRLAPLDHRAILSRFLTAWRPRALIVVEGELWPNRFDLCRIRRVPVILAGARMSERAQRRWSRRPALALAMMDAVRFLSAQDDVSERRFRALGLTPDRIGPVASLKAGAFADAPGPAAGKLPFPRSLTILAASTHEGEDEPVLDAFAAARRERPGLRLIIAPRHPRRRPAIEAAIRARGLSFRTRSAGQEPAPEAAVYLADTMGEMARWYAAAGTTFVGGSLVDQGGHTPFEPAAHGSAILHGPHVANFAEAYAALDAGHGALRVNSPTLLARRFAALADPARQSAMARAAREALADFASRDGIDAILAAIGRAADLPALFPDRP